MFRWVFLLLVFVLPCSTRAAEPDEPLKLLFLGDDGHHQPARRFEQIRPVLAARGIDVQYSEELALLNPQALKQFEGLIIYANHPKIEPEHEQALLDFVAGGKGFIPLHCASYCFLNSDAYVRLVGAQFARHGTGTFGTEIAAPNHPIMQGFGGFTSWDETYVHRRHHPDNRTVLEYRVQGEQADGQQREPWTWVHTHGKGRVFYTAWGHDQRTWGEPGFHNLLERGIRWACGQNPALAGDFAERTPFPVPKLTEARQDVAPFTYVDVGAKIPNYPPSRQWGTQAEPLTKMQRPLPPEESHKHFHVPKGFELRLFAAEPELGGKPICMNWDERGRLWVAETVDYPNELKAGNQGRDRIRICEDRDRDGKADHFTVFAEGLSIPTTLLPYRGGVIVQNGTETLYLKDTNGDNKADLRKVLISGWALGDTHGGVSNFHYGLDNWVWGMQGYNLSRPEINGEAQPGFRMGFFRFKLDHQDPPSVTAIEFIRSTNNNTWGLGFSEEGIVFGSTANRNPSVYMPIPNRYYERVRGWGPDQLGTIADTHKFDPVTDRIRQVDHHGGYTAGAGHALYTARNYPEAWWNRTAFVCGPTGHLVGTFVLNGQGADFRSTSPCNLVASDDEWTAPIMAEVGPDGNVWILDWYNFIVQHNPTPRGFKTGKGNAYESDLRDKKHGRIYRLVYTGNDVAMPVSLADAAVMQLVQALTSPTLLWRKQAQRLLVEQHAIEAVPQLLELLANQSTDAIGLNVGAIHALWTLHGLGVIDLNHAEVFAAVVKSLKHPSAGVRRNAALTLPAGPEATQAILQTGVCTDPDAQVQLAALLALADQPAHDAAGKTLAVLARNGTVTQDRWLADALTSAAASHAVAFLEGLGAVQKPTLDTRGQQLIATVAEHIARGKPDAATLERLLTGLTKADPAVTEEVLAGLQRGWPADHRITLGATANSRLVTLFERIDVGAKSQLLQLAQKWSSTGLAQYEEKILADLRETLTDFAQPDAARLAAARQLIEFRPADGQVVNQVLAEVTPQNSPGLTAGLFEALRSSTASSLGASVVQQMLNWTPGAKEAGLRLLLARPASTGALLDGLADGQVRLSDLKLDQKQLLQNYPDAGLRQRARDLMAKGGGIPNPDRVKVVEAYLAATKQPGEVAAGKLLFGKHCANCHMHSGQGQNIGPDLTGMAVHPKEELLVHILDPSRSVEGNYRTYTVATLDGRILNGMLAGESRTTIELIDTNAKRTQLQRADIDQLIASPKSLMPEGFEKQMTVDEMSHLLAFLTAKGRYLPLPLHRVATAISTKGLFHEGDNGPDRLVLPDWKPRTVAGVPFQFVDPRDKSQPNIILLNGPLGSLPPKMPRSVSIPCNTPAKAIHLLSGISGWGYPAAGQKSVSVIVRLRYANRTVEDHPLRNGVHFADYIRRVDVPGSEFAFSLGGQQLRYLAIEPKRPEQVIETIELVKGRDRTAPIVMAITVETSNGE